ncbi:RNA-binding protein [Streptomyces sp. NPDC046909]|uniref:RNA-binding protein n=1 Tax=Streptomyces sp. NPDC046909 TaxID=3155617 RepID=UPI0033E21BBC
MTDAITRVRELNLYRQYFDLAAGDIIRFRIKGTDATCAVRVGRVTEYVDFAALLDGEGAANVNPTATRDEQLADIRAIYPPEKEALGALAIEIVLL